jgi:hypothetical protein
MYVCVALDAEVVPIVYLRIADAGMWNGILIIRKMSMYDVQKSMPKKEDDIQMKRRRKKRTFV